MAKEPLYIVLLGPPGSGKGTQAQCLQDMLGLIHVASGDLFRQHFKNKTALGKIAKTYVERGELVPDDITIQMVVDRLIKPDCERSGAILDGFPRTVNQAKSLATALKTYNYKLNSVILFNIAKKTIIKRLTGRRICLIFDRVYHIHHNPPQQANVCDVDQGQLYQRSDDKPDTVLNRLNVYQENTQPLVDYYKKKNLLLSINSDQPIKTVTNLLHELITENKVK